MRILLVHQNFPGQFKHLAVALAADPANQVVGFTMKKDAPTVWQGVRLISYQPARSTSTSIHPWVSETETKVIRGEAAFHAALRLRSEGFVPDVIIAHPGWGESLFLKDVWPDARLGIYCEFYYRQHGLDADFDPEFPSTDTGDACRIRLKNINNFVHFEIADGAIAPTRWQASTFPDFFRPKITVVHDGIDTDTVAPNPGVKLVLNEPAGKLELTRHDEIITFVNRNLEPYRGYHIFMRALPEILARRPQARVVIVGGKEVSYGARPPAGKTWKDIFWDEVKGRVDTSRVHFLGLVPYEHFLALLQLSTVHVYLTYPFVLSWSLLEAMSCGCAIVASGTPPLKEAVVHGETGKLVDFFDPARLATEVLELLQHPDERERLGQAARAFARVQYDLKKVCLPRQIDWVRKLASGRL